MIVCILNTAYGIQSVQVIDRSRTFAVFMAKYAEAMGLEERVHVREGSTIRWAWQRDNTIRQKRYYVEADSIEEACTKFRAITSSAEEVGPTSTLPAPALAALRSKLYIVQQHNYNMSIDVVRAKDEISAGTLILKGVKGECEVTELALEGEDAILWSYETDRDSRPERD